MVTDVEIEVPLFEDVTETKTSTYYDFDPNGDIIEKTREDQVTRIVQTGTQTIIKQKIDINKEEGAVYSFAYNLVKKEFRKIFGDENIIDE